MKIYCTQAVEHFIHFLNTRQILLANAPSRLVDKDHTSKYMGDITHFEPSISLKKYKNKKTAKSAAGINLQRLCCFLWPYYMTPNLSLSILINQILAKS